MKHYTFKIEEKSIDIVSIDLLNYKTPRDFGKLNSFIKDMTKGTIDLYAVSVFDNSVSYSNKSPITFELRLDGSNLIISQILCESAIVEV